MRTEFISSMLVPGGAGYTIRKSIFRCEEVTFTISSPFDNMGRGVAESVRFTQGWPAGNGTVTLTVTMGKTSASTEWSEKDAIEGRFIQDFALDLHRMVKDGSPLFEVELKINHK